MKSPSSNIDAKINELGDCREKPLAQVRELIHKADPDIVEECNWAKATCPGSAVWPDGAIVCTGETYKGAVKMTFAKGAPLAAPSGLFNSSFEANVPPAIDIHEGDKINQAALKDLICAA